MMKTARQTILGSILLALLTILPQGLSAQDHIASLQQRYEELHEQVYPSIVGISQKTNPREVHPSLGLGTGSGVIISEDGWVITSSSNLNPDNRKVHVIHSNRRVYEADWVNTDPYTTLALLKINVEDETFQPLAFADSDKAAIGTVVMTLGNAYGSISQGNPAAFSVGIISGRYVPLGEGNYRGEVLETDAAINPGSFGGALVNSQGRLAGMVVDTISYHRWLGTAIPSNLLLERMELLKNRRTVIGPADFGISVREEEGQVLVAGVEPNSHAGPAGIKEGMTILRLNGRDMKTADIFLSEMVTLPAGSIAQLDIQTQDGELRTVRLNLMPLATLQGAKVPAHITAPQPGSLGCVVRTLNGPQGGARIIRLEELGAGRKAGLEKEDVIFAVNGVRMRCAAALARTIRALPVGSIVTISFYRDGKTMTKEVRLRGLPT